MESIYHTVFPLLYLAFDFKHSRLDLLPQRARLRIQHICAEWIVNNFQVFKVLSLKPSSDLGQVINTNSFISKMGTVAFTSRGL